MMIISQDYIMLICGVPHGIKRLLLPLNYCEEFVKIMVYPYEMEQCDWL
jgi:hypothetical protein